MNPYLNFLKNDMLKLIIEKYIYDVIDNIDVIEFSFNDILYHIRKIYIDDNSIDYKLYTVKSNNEYEIVDYLKMIALFTHISLHCQLHFKKNKGF